MSDKAAVRHFLLSTLVSVILLFVFCAFTVDETQRAMVKRFGNLKTTDGQVKIYKPGLHFKVPILDDVLKFDSRILTIELPSASILTKEKKDVMVDLFVKWRIRDFPKYYKNTSGTLGVAERLLREKIVDGLRAEFGQRTIREVVSGERQGVMDTLKKASSASAKHLGIEVVDTRIKRIDLPDAVRRSVYERMRAERKRIADEHRAMGDSKAEAIQAQADAKVVVILAEANEKSKIVRGEGDREAAKIYNDVLKEDLEFYAFYRRMQAYLATFKDKNDILVVKPDSDFFRYFHGDK